MIDWERVHILVVEDSPTQAMLISNHLKEKKINLDVVKNGKEALTFLETKKTDLVISDINMPEINGYELCKKIRSTERVKNLPVILYTSLTDQGQGIPQEEQKKLFKTFSKTTVKTTAGELSTGLGLAIVKKIVLAHEGEISCTSEVGKGSTFSVKLPLKQKKSKAAA